MRHKIYVDSSIVLDLIKSGTIESKEVDLYDFQKKKEPTADDLNLFELCVEASSDEKRLV